LLSTPNGGGGGGVIDVNVVDQYPID